MSESKKGIPGTVSHGTLRPEDLVPKFCFLLEELWPERAAQLTSEYSGDGWPYSMAGLAFGDPFEGEQVGLAPYLLEDLFDALDECSPDGHYFGAHCGDGSDFGFWPVEEED